MFTSNGFLKSGRKSTGTPLSTGIITGYVGDKDKRNPCNSLPMQLLGTERSLIRTMDRPNKTVHIGHGGNRRIFRCRKRPKCVGSKIIYFDL